VQAIAQSDLPVHKKIKRVEMLAVNHILDLAVPPIRIHTDHAAIVAAIHRGKDWCCRAARPHADVWRAIWRKLEDIGVGEEGVTVAHVKAHRTEAAIEALPQQQRIIARGNAFVDAAA
jgi:hypothetical protein